MAIRWIRPEKAAVSHTASVTEGRSYTVQLKAEVDSLSTGPGAIRAWLHANGFHEGSHYFYPLGSPTEEDFCSLLKSIQVAPSSADGLQYRVTLEYGPYGSNQEMPSAGDRLHDVIINPTQVAPTLRWASEDQEFACTHDRDGKPILNAAGDPFDPPITTFLPTPIANVSRVETAFLPAWITIYKNTVNDAPWMGFPAESVLCKDITADRTYDPNHGYLWTVNYTFAFRPSILASDGETVIVTGWDAQVLNAGKRELRLRPPLTAPVRVPVNIDGAPVSDPVPLTTDGNYDPEGEPNFLRFALHPKKDFSFFNFPSNLFAA